MKRIAVPLSALALLFAVSTANAEQTQGKVAAVDEGKRLIQLEDGATFRISEDVSIEQLAPGVEVTLTYDVLENGEMIVTAVEVKG